MTEQQQQQHQQRDALTAHLIKEDKYKAEPWRRDMDKTMDEHAILEKTTLEQQQRNFLEYAKQKMLTPDDVLVGFYVLFANPQALRAFTENLLRKTKQQRIAAHNWLILSLMKDEGLERHFGSVLGSLPAPLFPPTPDFAGVNLALLREWSEHCGDPTNRHTTGTTLRGAGPQFTPSVFARPLRTRPTGGEPFFEVQDLGGRAVVDMAPANQRQLRRCNSKCSNNNSRYSTAQT